MENIKEIEINKKNLELGSIAYANLVKIELLKDKEVNDFIYNTHNNNSNESKDKNDKDTFSRCQTVLKPEKNKIVKYPKVESLMNKFGRMNLQNYSIKTSQADKDLLDIFDRAQKTHASTLGKVGNYEYYSTYQRIGSFMDFSQHLKIEALEKIGRDIYQNRRNLLEYQSKHNIQKPTYGNLLINKCSHFRDSNSLFHGFMPFEEVGQFLISNYNKRNNIYDPLDFMPKYGNYYLLDEDNIDQNFINSVLTSIKNYNKYLDSDKFTSNDVKKFNKNLLKKSIIKKIDSYLLWKKFCIILKAFWEETTVVLGYFFTNSSIFAA